MATKYGTSEEAQSGILKELQAVQSQLRAAIQRGEVAFTPESIEKSPYGQEIKRLESQLRSTGTLGEIGTGIVSTVMGSLTGIPDLLRMGINVAGKAIGAGEPFTGPSLQERAMSAIGLATEPTSTEAQVAYYAPDVLTGVYGIASLGKAGFKGAKELFASRKAQKFMSTLPENEANLFSQFMMKGQGSDDPRVAAILQKLQRNPEYSEIFTKLQEGATKAAAAGVTPRPSRITPEEAVSKAVTGVEESVKALKDTRAEAGTKAFAAANEAGGDRNLVSVDNTLQNIRDLKARFATGATDSSKKAVQFLTSIEESLQPTRSTIYGAQQGRTITTPARDAFGNIIEPAPTTYRGPTGMSVPLTEPVTIGGGAGIPTQRRMVPKTDALGKPVMETYLDAAGMPYQRPVMVEATFGGAPSTTGITYAPEQQATTTTVLQASRGTPVSWRTEPEKLTVSEIQGLLAEFGVRAAKGESLVTDLSLGDQKVISAAIFGGLKDDLKNSLKIAGNTQDKKALGLLVSARKQSKDAADAYNDIVSKGMPKMLQEKSLASIEPEDLLNMYEKLTPNQRGLFRDYVGTGRQEALQFIDNAMFKKFIKGAEDTLPDGTIGTDLGKLAKEWAMMGANEKDILARSLGQNLNEFSARMKDALVFTRKMDVLSPQDAKGILDAAGRDIAAVVGASPAGYSGAKATQLLIDGAKAVASTKMSEDQLMKLLLTSEGADFLKKSALSPASRQTLEALTTVKAVTKPTYSNPLLKATVAGTVSEALTPSTEQPSAVTPEEMPPVPEGAFPPIPEGVFDTQPQEDTTEGLPPIPPGVFATSPSEQQMSQDVNAINTQGPGMMTQDAVSGIQNALNSGELQGAQAEEARRLLQGMSTGLFSR